MNSSTERLMLGGPAGLLEAAIDRPSPATATPAASTAPNDPARATSGAGPAAGVAVLCHPHPQFGGTMDNKVVVTLSRAFVQLGHTAVRFNVRGTGESAGAWDEGRGEVDDALAVIAAVRRAGAPLFLGGFSFGGYLAAAAAARLAAGAGPSARRLVLVAPAVSRFEMPAVPADTLLVHGERDDVVPLADVLDWARPQSLPLTVVPGAGHFFHGQITLLKHILVAALR